MCASSVGWSLDWRKTPDGLAISQGINRINIVPYTANTFRVTVSAVPSRAPVDLAVIAKPSRVPFSVIPLKSGPVLATKAARIVFDAKEGTLKFLDGKGKLLLAEAPNARSFSKTTLAGQQALSGTQAFRIVGQEAFYGLGCLQLPILDLRGGTYTLVQDNTIDVNPMLVTTGGYGILWNNASKTTVSIADRSEAIPANRLYDRNGVQGALSGDYFRDKGLSALSATRRDAKLSFRWLKEPIEGVPENFFSVRWSGFLKTGRAGHYRFIARADDGVRLWVNGKRVIDDWRVHPLQETPGTVWLPANARVPIRLEFFDETNEAEIDLKWAPPSERTDLRFASDVADRIDYFFIAAPDIPTIVGEYRNLTGQAPLLGKWAYGFWQCKERYQTQDEIVGIAKQYRERKIPIDNIVQDWFYWRENQWGSHEFDPSRFPDPAKMLRDLHQLNFHVMVSVWAKFDPETANAKLLDSKGFLYPKAIEQARYYDAFNPKAREQYWELMRDRLFSLGYDAWWLDATEPEIPMDRFREFQTALGPAGRYLNAYSLMTTKGVYEGQRKAAPEKRVFILTRSAFSGQQRHSAVTWSGDIYGSWDIFRRQVASGLNFCLAGVPYWCTDIGGFFSPPNSDPAYQELFVRWFQWGAFNPIFRVHGTGTDKELWRWGAENERILVQFDRLRYRLMPYIYSAAWQVTKKNATIMRALPYDFAHDPRTWKVADQFMFGPSIMVCPVVEPGAVKRKVLLPKNERWYDFWTGAQVQGDTATLDAPRSSIPLLVRAGSVVPLGPFVQHAAEQPGAPIELRVYPGRNGEFVLYDDEGDGYGYEAGKRSEIRIEWNDKQRRLTFGKRLGSYPNMPAKRTFRVVLVRPSVGEGIEVEPRFSREVVYTGKRQQVSL